MSIFHNYWHVAGFSIFTWSTLGVGVLIMCFLDLLFKHEINIGDIILNFILCISVSLIFNFYTTHQYNETVTECQTLQSQGYHMVNGDCVVVTSNGKTSKLNME